MLHTSSNPISRGAKNSTYTPAVRKGHFSIFEVLNHEVDKKTYQSIEKKNSGKNLKKA